MTLAKQLKPHVDWKNAAALLALTLILVAARAQVSANPVTVKLIAEVELTATEQGRETKRLVPADRVVPGDRLIYTLEVVNTAATTAPAPAVTTPVPAHMRYVAESAVGPGTDVSFSVDGGLSFDAPENLQVKGPDGEPRAAEAADYTHIRWQFRNSLKANSVAFVRFRAIAK
jgi:uncharacterized repeat protein (TIGR01451 family)